MPELHPQLAALRRELDEATARAARLAERLDEGAFARRPPSGGWSPAECVAHLTLTAKSFLPLIDGALASATLVAVAPGRRYRKDPVGAMLAWIMEPPYRMKVKTTAPFMPEAAASRAEVMRDFAAAQAELAARMQKAGGYDLLQVKVPSPFSSRMRYNLFSTFSIITAHERRHLWQAEQHAQAKA